MSAVLYNREQHPIPWIGQKYYITFQENRGDTKNGREAITRERKKDYRMIGMQEEREQNEPSTRMSNRGT